MRVRNRVLNSAHRISRKASTVLLFMLSELYKMAGVLILVLASMAVFSATASSPRLAPPNIPDSFTATGEVEIHTAEGTEIGAKCKLFFLLLPCI